MQKPDKLEVLVSNLQQYYSRMHSEMEEDDRLYRHEYSQVMGTQYDVPTYDSSTSSNIVDAYKNQIRTDEPTVNFRAAGPSRTAQEAAALMQRWGYGILRRERANSITDPNMECAFNLLLRGAACKKILVDIDKIPEEPKARRGTKAYDTYESELASYWPFKVYSVDPYLVYPNPGSSTPLRYVIEFQQRRAIDMWEQYPDWSDPIGTVLANSKNIDEREEARSPARRVRWVEYWDDEHYIVEVDGERILDKENPYGFVPYIWEFSGLGKSHYDGDPYHLATSILSGIRGDIKEEVRLMTAASVGTLMAIFPTLLTTEDPREMARRLSIGPGRILRHPPGQEPKYLEPPPLNDNVYKLLDAVRANISRVYNEVLQGGRPQGVDYGILQAQLTSQALTTIKPVRDTLDRMGSHTLNMMARMAHIFDLRMNVEGSLEKNERTRMVDGADFEHFNFSVTFEAADPALNDRMLMAGEALRRAGDISQRTFWTKFAKHVVEDADEEEALLYAEMLLKQMVASGALNESVLGKFQAAMAQEQVAGVEKATKAQVAQPGELQRQQETTPGALGQVMSPALATEQLARQEVPTGVQ